MTDITSLFMISFQATVPLLLVLFVCNRQLNWAPTRTQKCNNPRNVSGLLIIGKVGEDLIISQSKTNPKISLLNGKLSNIIHWISEKIQKKTSNFSKKTALALNKWNIGTDIAMSKQNIRSTNWNKWYTYCNENSRTFLTHSALATKKSLLH